MRKTLVAGNWKSNGNLRNNLALIDALKSISVSPEVEVLLCPPFIYIPQVMAQVTGTDLMVGAQNCSATEEGAFTGECTAAMLKDSGVDWVILGHSERRTLYGETDEVVAKKVELALAVGLTPIICIGETLEEREAGKAEAVCLRQLDAVISRCKAATNWVVAYEPVWAIGTGKTASSEDAQEMHSALRTFLADKSGEVAQQIRILYGGSVKPGNATELFAKADIDGALVGGASLSAGDFAGIIASANG
jgi:triosephosphate isomerase (TIM)